MRECVIMCIEVSALSKHQRDEINDKQKYNRYGHNEAEGLKLEVHEVGNDVISFDQREGNVYRGYSKSLFYHAAVHQHERDEKLQCRECKEVKKHLPNLRSEEHKSELKSLM